MSARNLLLVFVSLTFTICFQGPGASQTIREVYNLDFNHSERAGNDDTMIAWYWIDFAKREHEGLRLNRRPELGNQQERFRKLDEILTPIFKLEKLLINFPPGEQRLEVLRDITALRQDFDIAESAFNVLGAEHCMKFVFERSAEISKIRHSKKTEGGYGIRSYFDNNGFLDALGISAQQRESIESLIKSSRKSFRSEINEILEELHIDSERRWKSLLKALAPHQRAEAETLIGKPVEWFRLSKVPYYRTVVGLNGTYSGGSVSGPNAMKHLSRLDQMTEQELKDANVERFDPLVYRIVADSFQWSELELSVEQRNTAKSSYLKKLKQTVHTTAGDQNRMMALIAKTRSYPESLVDFLVPSQIDRLAQIELQIRFGTKHDSTVGLSHNLIKDKLAITRQQLKELVEIGKSFDEKITQARATAIQFASDLRQELSNDISAVLSEKQRVLYKRFTGKKLETKKE